MIFDEFINRYNYLQWAYRECSNNKSAYKKTIQRKTMRNVTVTVNELIFNALIQILRTNQRGRHNGIQ